MKKVLAYSCLVLGIAAMAISSSSRLMHKVWDWNAAHSNEHAWWSKHANMKGGDLVKLSFLDDIRKFQEAKDYRFPKAADTGRKKLNLYLFGDSYTEDLPGAIFAGTASYHYGSRLRAMQYLPPAAGEKNILMIEVTERLAVEIFASNSIFNLVTNGDTVAKKQVPQQTAGIQVSAPTPAKKQAYKQASTNSYSQTINTNLEYILFDYGCINRIRQLKADMNYMLFSRASGNVAVSDNDQYIFYQPTIAQSGPYSIYTPVPAATLDNMIFSLNELYAYYKAAGFTEVYLSLIPNAATILQPTNYNGLISRIQANPALKMPVIDLYSAFRKSTDPATLYRKGDTHWNNNGMHLWLGIVNNELTKQNAAAR